MKKINLFEIDTEYYNELEKERETIISSLNNMLNSEYKGIRGIGH